MMPMNLIGRLGNFSLSVEKALLPVFEAITNSIHALDEAKRASKDGEIVVHIHRYADQPPLSEDNKPLQPVIGFTIEDNGIGFTDQHYNSFCTSDSILKRAKGGKGVGRLCWVKVFQKAEITSIFEQGSSFKRRTFSFEVTPKGVEGHQLSDTDVTERRTQGNRIIQPL